MIMRGVADAHLNEMARVPVAQQPYFSVLRKNTNGKYTIVGDPLWNRISKAYDVFKTNSRAGLNVRTPQRNLPGATTLQKEMYVVLGMSKMPYPCPRNKREFDACPIFPAFIKDFTSQKDFSQKEFEALYKENMG